MHELILFLEAGLISFLLTGAILRFSLKRSLLDIPNDRSSHSIPKPRLGGVAITVAFCVTFATMLMLGLRPFPTTLQTVGFCVGGALIAAVGLTDDLHGLNAPVKLVTQLAASGFVVYSGIVLTQFKLPLVGTLELGPLAVPITILWIVGFINLYNFIDGIDGLAAGVGLIASVFLLLIGQASGVPSYGGCYAALAGSSFGFLRYNFPPARIFMGDMGSTVMGFVFAVLAVAGSAAGVPAFVTLLLLGAAIGDAALTLARRVARRERIFSPHRTHYYQRLTSLGLSHKQVTLLEYLVAALLGVSALFTFKGDRLFVTFFSVTWLVFFLLTLAKIRSMERGGRLFWEGRTVAVAAGDLVFIAASYILSYYLRLNFSIPEAHASSMLMSLPLVLVIRSVVFYYYGLYRSVWRYTTFDDVARIVKAISLSSLIMIVSFTLLFRFRAFPRSVFIIDWFILTVFITGSRIATRWFHELPQKEEVSGKRILIGGTGPMAELVVQQLKKTGGCRPVGFLDDRSEMIGRMIHGMEVLGPSGEIERIVRKHEIDEIVCIRSLLDRFPAPLLLSLQKTGVTVRVVSDPSEVPDVGSDSRQRAPFAGMRVLVAGNGELAECAGAIFTDARGITVISDEARVLGESVALSHSHGEGISVYLGLLGDREALSAIIERHRPELIIADFTTGTGSLSNPMEGYVRTVIIPMERMARLAAEGGDVRFIAIVRCADPEGSGAECAPLALEKILGEVFASGRDSCTIVRSPMRMSATAWAGGLHELPPSGGSVYRIETGETGNRVLITRISALPEPSGAGSLFLELVRKLGAGGEQPVRDVLARINDTATVRTGER